MQLILTQLFVVNRQTYNCNPAVALCVVPAWHRPCTRPPRNVTARSSKATSLGWDDLANALPRVNPEKRILQDINFFQLVRECPDWEALQRMETDLRDRYDRQPALAMAVLLRTSEVVDVEAASDAERKAVAKMLNSSIVPFIIKKGIYSYKASSLPPLLAALAALQYSNARLDAVLLKLLESSVDSLMLGQLCSALCSAASLELRMGPELLDKVIARLDYTLKFCTTEDVGNLATALAPYNKLPPSGGFSFLSRLAAHSEPSLEELSGEQLVDLLVLFVRQNFPLTGTWVTTFQNALLAGLPGLTRPRSYASLLFSLAKGSIAISEGFLSSLLERLAEPAVPGARRRTPDTAYGSGSDRSLLSRMRPVDLAVVAAVLSIYGYQPPKDWCESYVEALERRAGDLDAKQVVTVVDTCVELGIPLSADLLDEMLAVAEGGLAALPAARLLQLVSALGAVGHQPDGPWTKQLTAALVTAAGRCSGAELVDVVAVLPDAPYAYPPDGEATAVVLTAVKARAAELKGLDASTRGSILQLLKDLQHPGAAALVDSLAPEPAPPKPAAAASPAGRAAVVAAAATGSAARVGASGSVSTTPAPASTSTSAATAAVVATAPLSGSRLAPSQPARAYGPPSAAPSMPPPTANTTTTTTRQQQQQQQQLVGSTRTFGRRRSFDDDEEEDKMEEDEEEEEDDYEGEEEEEEEEVRRRATARRTVSVPSPRAAPPPPAYSGGMGDVGFFASTRASRRR
ncbi:hypothetical protein Vretimale_19696 [Volvox reticuliferus]|uniref:Uncharacterized protein n=1 Tax=Volvox reticuliferus TaxID=1737510 RepID=A0A8J4FFJ5_9CHLO|nr:hypothetical protein Vretifemale_820 [Volvox reticuliferus]GIM17180.1 hypothetical protein Vretimale_19696 [Volvox reticuliferus]